MSGAPLLWSPPTPNLVSIMPPTTMHSYSSLYFCMKLLVQSPLKSYFQNSNATIHKIDGVEWTLCPKLDSHWFLDKHKTTLRAAFSFFLFFRTFCGERLCCFLPPSLRSALYRQKSFSLHLSKQPSFTSLYQSSGDQWSRTQCARFDHRNVKPAPGSDATLRSCIFWSRFREHTRSSMA